MAREVKKKSRGVAVPKGGTAARLKKDGTPFKPRRARNGRAAIREMMRLQGKTSSRSKKAPKGKDEATMLLIFKSTMRAEIKDAMRKLMPNARVQSKAYRALHVAVEDYVTDVFNEVAWIVPYCRRVEATSTDLVVAEWLLNTQHKERNAQTFPVAMPLPVSARGGDSRGTSRKKDPTLSVRRFQKIDDSSSESPRKSGLAAAAGKAKPSLKDRREKERKLKKKLQKQKATAAASPAAGKSSDGEAAAAAAATSKSTGDGEPESVPDTSVAEEEFADE